MPIAGSSRARCSCRSTGRPRTALPGASARWCSRRPIPIRASPKPRRRRRASPRSPSATTALALSRQRLHTPASPYWAGLPSIRPYPPLRPGCAGGRLDCAGCARPCPLAIPDHFDDAAAGSYRAAVLREDVSRPWSFVGPSPGSCRRSTGSSRGSSAPAIPPARASRLARRPTRRRRRRRGPIVCVCFQVGAARIAAAVAEGGRTVEKIGARLGAGTNCGSCVPEIRRLIAANEPGGSVASSSGAHEPA